MLERLAFKECLKKCLADQGHTYHYDHRKHYKNYERLCTRMGYEIPMEAYAANHYITKQPIELAPLPKAVPWPCVKCPPPCEKQEGNKPMRAQYNDNYASATVTAPKSDLATSREYFLKRIQESKESRYSRDFGNLFNLYTDNAPKNFKDLIERIKGGKYTIDPKVEKKFEARDDDQWFFGDTYGIIWEGPKADHEGYDKAVNDLEKQETSARDAIMAAATTGDMKAALEAFEAWTPTVTDTKQ